MGDPVLMLAFFSLEKVWMVVLPMVGSVALTYAIFNLISDFRKVETKKVSQRLREKGLGETLTEQAVKESILRRQARTDGLLSSALSKSALVARVQSTLDRASLEWSAAMFLVNLLGIACLFYIVGYFLDWPLWLLLVSPAASLVLPLVFVVWVAKRRMRRFMNQLPDVFELMSQALRAGHSLSNAILLVSQQLPDPVGTEFARVFHEQNLGIKLEESLQDMGRRVDIMDVRFFVTAVLIQRQTGGDLAEVLDNISCVIRDRIKLFGAVRALTAEGRLSGYVLLALPVVVFFVEMILNPKYASVMIDEEMGRNMLIGAGISQLFGMAVIQKIINIKV
jgi:tight adherence protein B